MQMYITFSLYRSISRRIQSGWLAQSNLYPALIATYFMLIRSKAHVIVAIMFLAAHLNVHLVKIFKQ